MFNFRLDQYFAFGVVLLALLLSARQVKPPVKKSEPTLELVKMADLPSLKKEELVLNPAQFTATLSAQAVLAIDVESASILLAKNKDQRLAPASTTKIMTALVAADLYDLDELITVPTNLSVPGHTIDFKAGQKFTVQNLFKALLINSGNDAAVILAHHHPQDQAGFVKAMNQKAQELGLKKTSFINSSGLDAAAHYSTAFELSIMARELMKNDFFRQLVATKEASITDLNHQSEYYLHNTNQLLDSESGVVGIKTGTTNLAGQALITEINRKVQGKLRRVLVVILGSKRRYQDSQAIIDWLFSHYQWQEISVK